MILSASSFDIPDKEKKKLDLVLHHLVHGVETDANFNPYRENSVNLCVASSGSERFMICCVQTWPGRLSSSSSPLTTTTTMKVFTKVQPSFVCHSCRRLAKLGVMRIANRQAKRTQTGKRPFNCRVILSAGRRGRPNHYRCRRSSCCRCHNHNHNHNPRRQPLGQVFPAEPSANRLGR